MIARLDQDQTLGLGKSFEDRLELGDRSVLIVRALHENPGNSAVFEVRAVLKNSGKPDSDDATGACSTAAQTQHNARAERESCQRERQIGIALAQISEAGAGVFHLAFALVVGSLTEVDAAIVEAQHYTSGAAQTSRDPVDHFVVHGPAVLRM